MGTARELNEERRQVALTDYVSRAVPEADLVAKWPGAAQQLDSLPSLEIDGERRFPAWLLSGGARRPELGRVLALLADYAGTDGLVADRVMRLPQPDLGGLTILELLDDPARPAQGFQLLAALGGG